MESDNISISGPDTALAGASDYVTKGKGRACHRTWNRSGVRLCDLGLMGFFHRSW